MKIKGIPIWEQHIEKLVLGVAALGFAAFAATQFIGNPNEVKQGAESFTPANVDQKLQAKAQAIQTKMDPSAPSVFDPPPLTASHANFETAITESISPAPKLHLVTPVIAPNIGDLGEAVFAYHVPVVPAPHDVRVQQYADALAEGVVDQHEQLKQRFPSLPHDIIWPTPFFKFNADQLRKELHAGDPNAEGTGERPIPPKWYEERAPIVDLVLEREELDPLSGQWTNLMVIAPIPGQNTLRDRIAGEMTTKDRQEILDLLAVPENQTLVLQPEFYPTKNSSWAVASFEKAAAAPAVEDDPVAEKIESLKGLLTKRQTELQRKEVALKDAGGPLEEPPDKPKGPKEEEEENEGDGQKPPRSGFGFSDSGGPSKNKPGDESRNTAKRLQLTKDVNKLKAAVEKLQQQLQELGAAIAPVQEVSTPSDPNTDNEIVMWAHDITAVPGKTYRYRAIVQMYNPFYGRSSSLVDSQKQLAASFVLASQPGAWSEPIEISEPLRHFITRATPPRRDAAAAAMGGMSGQVTAEVFRFFDGRWWTESFTTQSGERVGELVEPRRRPANDPAPPAESIDYSTQWFVLDVLDDFGSAESDPLVRKNSALVLLQNMQTGEMTELIDPDRQRSDADLRWLREQVEASLQVADAAPPAAPGDSATP